MLELEFKYFKDNREELYKNYPNKFLVIKDCAVQYSGDSFEDSLMHASGKFEIGTFIIQQCTKGEEGYTQTFHSRVIFA